MDIEEFIKANTGDGGRSSTFMAKKLREAYAKYNNCSNTELQVHLRRIQSEVRMFGQSFATTAGITIIEKLVEERTVS